jgi:antitoxin component of MazEF toxin-antitoxin module
MVRRIGNSLGVLLPKPLLEVWGVREGDHLELSEHGVRAPRKPGSSQELLDERKRLWALAVVGSSRRDRSERRVSLICIAGETKVPGFQPMTNGNESWRVALMAPSLRQCWAATKSRIDYDSRCRSWVCFRNSR